MIKLLRGPVFWLLLILAFTPFALTVGPVAETRLWPVYTSYELVSVQEISPGRSSVVVAFNKVRSCEPAGYAWYKGSRESGQFAEIEVRSVSTGTTIGRPLGRQLSQPFEVSASPADLRDVFINVFHRCPFQPWVTKSEVYP
jgi:hypothetical protein